jgi:hypothetical protein
MEKYYENKPADLFFSQFLFCYSAAIKYIIFVIGV